MHKKIAGLLVKTAHTVVYIAAKSILDLLIRALEPFCSDLALSR